MVPLPEPQAGRREDHGSLHTPEQELLNQITMDLLGQFCSRQIPEVKAVWSTNTVNISSVGYAIINVEVYSALVEANDYVRISYVLDGTETLFYELIGGNGGVDLTPETPASAIVAGNSLQLKIYVQNDPVFLVTSMALIT